MIFFFTHADEDLLKRLIELRQRLSILISRENKITYYDDDDCSSESDMEEVPPSSCVADDLLVQCLATKSNDNDVTSLVKIKIRFFFFFNVIRSF